MVWGTVWCAPCGSQSKSGSCAPSPRCPSLLAERRGSRLGTRLDTRCLSGSSLSSRTCTCPTPSRMEGEVLRPRVARERKLGNAMAYAVRVRMKRGHVVEPLVKRGAAWHEARDARNADGPGVRSRASQ
eukprot:scaffold30190_cov53-Phaeocystis_antarctica.AAC.1